MHIKFLGHGEGKGSAAIAYVLGEIDHKGQERIFAPVVLRGNPLQTGALADSLDFKNKYRSAVIAWHPEDKPTDEQIDEVITEFERLAFSGLEPDQYDYTAVLHREIDSEHVHVIIPRVELSSGKSYNPSPPGWQKYYDPLRDYFNGKYNWKSPNVSLNPDAARVTLPEGDALRKGARLETKKIIEEYLLGEIEDGRISSREEIVISLQGLGFEITRLGQDYITILDVETNQKIRLKGVIYDKSWTVERTFESKYSIKAQTAPEEERKSRADAAYRELERRISERSRYNQSRYAKPIRSAKSRPDAKSTENSAQYSNIKFDDKKYLDQVSDYKRESLQWHLWRQLCDDAIFLETDQLAIPGNQTERAYFKHIEPGRRKIESEQVWRESEDLCKSRRETNISRWLQNFRIGMDIYDGIGTAVKQSFRNVINAIRTGHEQFEAACNGLSDTYNCLDKAIRRNNEFFDKKIKEPNIFRQKNICDKHQGNYRSGLMKDIKIKW